MLSFDVDREDALPCLVMFIPGIEALKALLRLNLTATDAVVHGIWEGSIQWPKQT